MTRCGPYNSAFVAEVYLWLALKQEARETFIGFLNHATPNYVWREEQSLQQAMVTNYTGDMRTTGPARSAFATCGQHGARRRRSTAAACRIHRCRYKAGTPTLIEGSPTRFGRIGLRLEP